jgi:hypothetical protein
MSNYTATYEAIWRAGFIAGRDHGNLQWKYPPEDVAWLMEKHHALGRATEEESAEIEAWDNATYEQRMNHADC